MPLWFHRAQHVIRQQDEFADMLDKRSARVDAMMRAAHCEQKLLSDQARMRALAQTAGTRKTSTEQRITSLQVCVCTNFCIYF